MKTVSYHLTAVSVKRGSVKHEKLCRVFFFLEPNKVSVIERCPYKGSNRKEGPHYAQIIFTWYSL